MNVLYQGPQPCTFTFGLVSNKGTSTVLFEDDATYIMQMNSGYIKGDKTKHISPKFFYTHELLESGEIDIHQVSSSDNLANLFTKSLSTAIFEKHVYEIGMRKLSNLLSSGGANNSSTQ